VRIKSDIGALLKQYERLYQKNETRIHASLKRVTDALHLRSIDRVPVLQMSQTVLYPRHEVFFSREKNLIFQLANINLTLEHDTDYVPYLDPFEGVTVLSEAFGCSVEVPFNGDPWIKNPLIRKNQEDAYSLKKPELKNDVYIRTLETLKYFEEKSGGMLRVGATDPQGPLDVASLIWNNQDFLQACVLNKKEAHYILDLVTEAFIEFYSMQYESLKKPAYPVHSFPLVDSSDGISISDDEAILLSPALYEEFGLPYLNRISDAFGGLYYHCCGDFGFILDQILKIRGLRAINGHLSPAELRPEYISKIIKSGVGLFLGISDREIGWEADSWGWNDEKKMYDSYYIPSAMNGSQGKGIVLVGYGSYFGYFDTPSMGREDEKKDALLVGASGHTIHRGPLVDISIEEKNAEFKHILEIIDRESKRMEMEN